MRTHLYQLWGVDLTRIDSPADHYRNRLRYEPLAHSQALCSWLGLAPHNDISGGKVLKSRTLKSKNRAAQALRTAAQSVGRSNSALGAYYRRMRARHGAPKAITATAHKLARIFYHKLKYGQDYNDPGQDYYELKYQERVIKNLQRKAKEFGMELVPQQNVS